MIGLAEESPNTLFCEADGGSAGAGTLLLHRFDVTRDAASPLLHQRPKGRGWAVSILWIILIVILVLALLGFFTRGRW